MTDDLDLAVVCGILRDLQRDHREEPFFAELFAVRGPGFLAASSAVSADRLTPVSVDHITGAWDGLVALLGVDRGIEVEDLEDLLDASPTYPG